MSRRLLKALGIKIGKIVFTWKALKKISDNNIVRSMYFWAVFVPLAAKVLALIESPLNMQIFGTSLSFQLSLPFSWTAFFFAAVSFSSALILFHLFSPKIIHDHPSYSHFMEEGKSRYQLKTYGQEVGFGKDEMETARNAAGKEASNEGEIQQMFWVTVEKAESTHRYARFLCSMLYYAGFGLMGIVFIQNIIYVILHHI